MKKKKQSSFNCLHPQLPILLIQLLVCAFLSFFLQKEIVTIILLCMISLEMAVLCGFKNAVSYPLFYIALYIIQKACIMTGISWLQMTVAVFASMILRLVPIYEMVQIIYKKTPMNELFYLLDRLHIPRAVSIPLIVVYRYAPTLSQEFRYISDSLKMRQMNLNHRTVFKPIVTVENYLTPLLSRSEKISSELSNAALVKGVSATNPRSSIYEHSWNFTDSLYTIFSIAGTGLLFFAEYAV